MRGLGRAIGVLFFFVFSAFCVPGMSQPYYVWVGLGEDNEWENPDNWSPSDVPPDGSDVYIIGGSENGTMIALDYPSTSHDYNRVCLNCAEAPLGSVSLALDGISGENLFSVNYMLIGGAGTAEVLQGTYDSADVSYAGILRVGSGGSYNLEQGHISAATVEVSGSALTPEFTQNDGTMEVQEMRVGGAGEVGTYFMNGGQLIAYGPVTIGPRSLFKETSGSVLVVPVSGLFVKGQYRLEGGVLDVNTPVPGGQLYLGSRDDTAYFYHLGGENRLTDLFVGYDPDGTGYASGEYYFYRGARFASFPDGTMRVSSILIGGENSTGKFYDANTYSTLDIGTIAVGAESGSYGEFNMDYYSNIVVGDLVVGGFGEGRFNHYSGNVRVRDSFVLGETENSQGHYTIVGPSTLKLECEEGYIGFNGPGDLVQNGEYSKVETSGSLVIGYQGDEISSYTLYSGSLHVGEDLYIGYNEYDGIGMLEEMSGSVVVDGAVIIGFGSEYRQVDGELTTDDLELQGGTVRQEGGDVYASSAWIGGTYYVGSAELHVGELTIPTGGEVYLEDSIDSIVSGEVVNLGLLSGSGQITSKVTHQRGVIYVGGDGEIGNFSFGSLLVDYPGVGPEPWLQFDLGGVDYYDQLVLDDGGTLGGGLRVSLLDGFLPDVGSMFDIILSAGGSLTGDFEWFDLPPLGEGREWAITKETNRYALKVVPRSGGSTVVPEPSSLALVLIGLGLVRIRRK